MLKYTLKELGNSKTSVTLVTSNAMLPTGANTSALGQFSLTHIDSSFLSKQVKAEGSSYKISIESGSL